MRPIFRPSARVSELPPAELCRAALLSSGEGGAIGDLLLAERPLAGGRGSMEETGAGLAASSVVSAAGGADGCTADFAAFNVAVARGVGAADFTVGGSGSGADRTGSGRAESGGGTKGRDSDLTGGTASLVTAGAFPARASIISRYGLGSCDVEISTLGPSSSTMRVTVVEFSATRRRVTSRSSSVLAQKRRPSIEGRVFRMSK